MDEAVTLDLDRVLAHLQERLGEERYSALVSAEGRTELGPGDLERVLPGLPGAEPLPAERELHKRAALVPTFDRELYERVLARELPAEAPAPGFDAFVAGAEIAGVPRHAGVYRLKEEARERHAVLWAEDEGVPRGRVPEALRSFAERLLEYLRAEGRGDGIEALPLRLLIDPEDGRERFETLYRAADRSFDLTRCHALLETATRWTRRFQAHLGPAMTALLGERRQYYEARVLFLEDYHQTGPYFLRDEVEEWLGRLSVDSDAGSPWIFHVHATGGMGKTMLLRWLIARRSIPEPRRIPCARLDFDHLDRAAAARYPWLMLLPLARQLDRQVPATPFRELLREYGWLEPALGRISADEEESRRRRDAERRLEARGPKLRDLVLEHLRSALTAVPSDRPLLVILDTLEETTLVHPEGLLATVRLLAGLHRECPGLRLILSGRYNILERLSAFAGEFGAQTDDFALGEFSDEEAVAYLREKRHVPEDAPLAALVERSGGIPFKLALFAELALTRPDLTEREVLEYPSTDFAYLIDRVIERLPEQALRWLIRYGVVPRDLTLDFLEKVIAPYLPEAGASEHDDPKLRWPDEARSFAERTIWGPGSGEIDLEALWSLLGDYASQRGWITFNPEGTALRFKPEVVDPMRRLLQPQPVFELLQRDAVRYFETRAAADPDSWVRWRAEAIFHRFQLEGAAAGEAWRELLADSRLRRDPAARKLVAETALDPGLAHDQREPWLRHDGSPMVDRATLLEAHVVAATAALDLAPLFEREPGLWLEASRHLRTAEGIRAEVPDAEPVSPRLKHLAAAADALGRGERPDASRHLGLALRSAETNRQRFSLRLQLANALAPEDAGAAEKHYRAAVELARGSSAGTLPLHQVRRLLGELLAERGDYEAAREELRLALSAGRRAGDHEETAKAAHRLADLHLESHRFERADDLLRELPDTFEAGRRRIELELALGRPRRALSLAAGLEADEAGDERRAWLYELRGLAEARLLSLRRAVYSLETAKRLWERLGAAEDEARCELHRLEMALFEIGDLGEADQLFEASERLDLPAGSPLWWRRRRLALVLRSRRGETGRAQSLWRELSGPEAAPALPREQARLLATGLALGLPEPDEDVARELVKTLRQIHPEPARWWSLEPLVLAEGPVEGLARRRGKLLSLLPRPDRLDLHTLPAARILAHLYRAFPQEAKGRDLLERAEGFCERHALAVPMRDFLAVRGRWPELRRSEPPRLDRFRDETAEDSPFEAALLLAAAAAIEPGEAARRLLAEVGSRDSPEELPFRLQAELHARRGRLARSPSEARKHLLEAERIYEQLEDEPAVAGVRREVEALEARFEEDSLEVATERGGLGFGLAEQPGFAPEPPLSEDREAGERTLSIRHHPDRGLEAVYLRIGEEPAALADPLPPWLAPTNEPGLPKDLLDRLRESDADHWLGDVLGTGRMAQLDAELPGLGDLRLGIPSGPLSAVPWELARYPSAEGAWLGCAPGEGVTYRTLGVSDPSWVRWVQAALNRLVGARVVVDGRWGPQTREALDALPGTGRARTRSSVLEALSEGLAGGPGHPRVLIVEPDLKLEMISQRGVSTGGALSVSDTYGAGAPSLLLEVVREASTERFGLILEDLRAEILHLVASFRLSTSGEVLLELPLDAYEASLEKARPSEGGMSASLLDSCLETAYGGRAAPLVVLDVPTPPRDREAVRQILMRNRFAAELLAHGKLWGVVATGLGLEHLEAAESPARRALVRGLDRGDSIGAIVGAMRRESLPPSRTSGPFMLVELAGSAGIALFAAHPALRPFGGAG